jgi:tetratricopeptide (TPR) repeat protein
LSRLDIAEEMLFGELEYRKGNFEQAFERLSRAITLEHNLPYDEPWGWMQPTRHAYGALLLEQDRVEEAMAVYRADLGFDDSLPRPLQHRKNVWALHGFVECLTRLGKKEELARVKPELQHALALADVPIKSSCFCRNKVMEAVGERRLSQEGKL